MVAVNMIIKRNFKGMGIGICYAMVVMPFLIAFFCDEIADFKTCKNILITVCWVALIVFILEGCCRLLIAFFDILSFFVCGKTVFRITKEIFTKCYIKHFENKLASHGGRLDFLMKSADWTVNVNVGFLLSKNVDAKAFLHMNGYYIEKNIRNVGSERHNDVYDKLKAIYINANTL